MSRRHCDQSHSVAIPTEAVYSAPTVVSKERTQTRQRPTDDEIRVLAHHKWVSAGQPEGDGRWFWVEAERELLKDNPA